MKTKRLLKILYYQKYLGIFLILIGLPMIIFVSGEKAAFPLMIGLYTLYTSMEKVEDERSISIKTSSLYIAFIFSYAVKLLVTDFYRRGILPFDLTEINHFVILVLSLAAVICYSRLYIIKTKDVNEEYDQG